MVDEVQPTAGKETPDPVTAVPNKEGEVASTAAQPATKVEPKEGEAVTKPAEPIKYDLKLPKDALVDKTDLERIEAEAKARGLSPEEAQSILDRENSTLASFAEKQKKQNEEIVSGWRKAVETDKEIGGADFGKNAELAKRAVDRFGSPEFKQALEETGLGSHPELVRVFLRIGKAMDNDSFVHGQPAGTNSKSHADILYGGTK